jgi:hypothetical protein
MHLADPVDITTMPGASRAVYNNQTRPLSGVARHAFKQFADDAFRRTSGKRVGGSQCACIKP